jgi:ABC-type sugar transport system ATPase subunit
MSQLVFQDFRIVRKEYVIEVENFIANPGQAIELQAPSGFGKTSVLRALLGLEAHEGRIQLGDRVLSSLPVHRRRIGMVFQDQALFTHQNALENAMSGMLLQGFSRRDAERRAIGGLERFEIRDRAYARVGELSGGERQRVAILRATLWKPSLLVLDEPFQGLDQKNRELISQAVTQFIAEHPVPMIWIDHQAKFEGLHLVGKRSQHDRPHKDGTPAEQRRFHLSESQKN